MSQLVIGTAGHIDHGKTALVKALTGTDTDRLDEEKARGMTIDLGFAFLNQEVTIIDVPGHERFIRNMVAGVSTIHLALLVVAADDGIMPQTIEHFNILKILGIPRGIIVITKCDLASDVEWLDLIEAEIEELVAGSFMEAAPVIRTSVADETGIEALREALLSESEKTLAVENRGFFRHQVDRVFLKMGFGAVVTGTVLSGSAEPGMEVQILPGGSKAKIRGLQSHGSEISRVSIGDRAAINLAGTDVVKLARGSELVESGLLQQTNSFIASVSVLAGTRWQIKHRQRIHLHIGTAEVLARVAVLERKALQAGQTGNIIINCEESVVAAMDDRFVIRSYSPMETIGGGRILDPVPQLKGRPLREWGKKLVINRPQRLEQYVNQTWKQPMTRKAWALHFNTSEKNIQAWLAESSLSLIPDVQIVYDQEDLKQGRLEMTQYLNRFHTKNPYREAVRREAVRNELDYSQPWFEFICNVAIEDGSVVGSSKGIALITHSVVLDPKDQRYAVSITQLLKAGHFTPPSLNDIRQTIDASPSKLQELLHLLKEQGVAVEIQTDLWYHMFWIIELKQLLLEYFRNKEELTVGEFKKITATTRKTAIPLLEYCDASKLTFRVGDVREAGKALQ